MLVQQLKTTDLNNEKMSKFDGTMVYAQNKRQQVNFLLLNPNRYITKVHPIRTQSVFGMSGWFLSGTILDIADIRDHSRENCCLGSFTVEQDLLN
jgi:hypothetical protein